MTEWISVKDRLPQGEKEVLTFGRGGYFLRRYGRGGWLTTSVDAQDYGEPIFPHRDVTHWMPLPDAPKGE